MATKKKISSEKLFHEDTVCKVTKSGKIFFGVVTTTADVMSDDDSDDSDSQNVTPEGFVRVAWHPRGNEQQVSINKVILSDRGLLEGDIVKSSQRNKNAAKIGTCHNVQMFVNLRILGSSDMFIYGVNAKQLKPLEDFNLETVVFYKSWVGVVQKFSEEFKLRLSDGSVCWIDDSIAEEMEDESFEAKDAEGFYEYEGFYPGQVLSGPLKLFDKARFEQETQKMQSLRKENNRKMRNKRISSTVVDKKLRHLGVQWQGQVFHIDERGKDISVKERPSFYITGDDLKCVVELNTFKHNTYQVGDRFVYMVQADDVIMSHDEWQEIEITQRLHNDIRKTEAGENSKESANQGDSNDDLKKDDNNAKRRKRRRKGSSFKTFSINKSLNNKRKVEARLPVTKTVSIGDLVVVEVVSTNSDTSVLWQDNTESTSVSCKNLTPVHQLDDHDFFPGDVVVPSSNEKQTEDPLLYGVVQTVDSENRIAWVKWYRSYTTSERTKMRPEYLGETEEPVYDLMDQVSMQFRVGSIVVKMFFGEACEKSTCGVGQVIKSGIDSDGYAHVLWADGVFSKCWPQELMKFGEYEDGGLVLEDEIMNGSLLADLEDDFGTENDVEDIVDEEEEDWETLSEESDVDSSDYLNPPEKDGFLRGMRHVYDSMKALRGKMDLQTWEKDDFKEILETIVAIIYALRSLEDFRGSSPKKFDQTINNILLMPDKNAKEFIDKGFDELCPKIDLVEDKTFPDFANSDEKKRLCHYMTNVVKNVSRLRTIYLQNTNIPPKTVDELLNMDFDQNFSFQCDSSKIIQAQEDQENETNDQNEEFSDHFVNVKMVESEKSSKGFSYSAEVPLTHKFKDSVMLPISAKNFSKAVMKEVSLLRSSLPSGIFVKAFEERMDLFSVMIVGPANTPYEDGLFFFDIRLSEDYPANPPYVHFWSFCPERLNPNLYVDGKVCVSLLGTWMGKGSQNWSKDSNLLQLLVSIQGLILNDEPYYNEAGYDRYRDTAEGGENSRKYNELCIIKVIQSMVKIACQPPEVFKEESKHHLAQNGQRFINRLQSYIDGFQPKFSLCPISKGFCISLQREIYNFKTSLEKMLRK